MVRLTAGLMGVWLVFTFLRSVSRVAVTNSPTGDWLAHRVGRFALAMLAPRALGRQTYMSTQDVLSWCLPLYMLLLIVVWFGLAQIGFALLIWASHAEHDPSQAMIASGSALSTLGFFTPQNTVGQLLAILEGATGLGIVVFYFTFIPGYQTAIQSRQAKVAWLYARTMECNSVDLPNFTLVEWFLWCGETDWNELWESWESWFRNLAETHTIAPVLAFVPTVHRGQTWLAAAAVALDSVSFYLATIEAKGRPSAIVCHRTGVDALRLIGGALPRRERSATAAGERRLSQEDFDTLWMRLEELGTSVTADRNACWLRFVELRREYENLLANLAGSLLVPGHCNLLLPLVVRPDGFSKVPPSDGSADSVTRSATLSTCL